MRVVLGDEQIYAIKQLQKGNILCGGTGSGKSRTAIGYYYYHCGGDMDVLEGKTDVKPLIDTVPDLYIITTAKKRDSKDWEEELSLFLISDGFQSVVVDSWNNIHKYKEIRNSFFIFDEQRTVGKGEWARAFRHIAQRNDWILLSATPGDKWEDYMNVFIANGFYRNPTDFRMQHIVYKPYMNFPVVDHYINQGILIRHRNDILVDIDLKRHTTQHHSYINVDYDRVLYKTVTKRWNPYLDRPIQNISELCSCWRRVANSDMTRQLKVLEIVEKTPKLIIFYNFDYELDILKSLPYPDEVQIAEWNGHHHEPIPKNPRWVYLVNYFAGAEGWNCIETDTILFYSQNYSHRMMEQACGRIDRRNTPFKDLYYYHLKSKSPIDIAISKALTQKKDFNESRYIKNAKV